MKKREYNWRLRDKRAESTVFLQGFPLEIRVKPTVHKQYCLVCRNKIEKGEQQIKLPYGMWGKHYEGGGAISILGGIKGSLHMRYYTRYVYLHPDCFGCTLNKMMLKAGLPYLQVKLVCDTCRNRFNCWTGNIDEEWRKALPAYQPARPCGVENEADK